MGRIYAYALSALLVGATAYPALRDPNDDSFPLSTYPMFSRPKPRETSVTAALAVGLGGFERPIPPGYVANSEAMLALQTIRKSVQGGRKSAHALCRAIASRVHAAGDPDFAAAREVVLVTSTVDSIKYLAGDTSPLARRVHARCKLEASAP